MNTYRVTRKMFTYEVADIEAHSPAHALAKVERDGDLISWDERTDREGAIVVDVEDMTPPAPLPDDLLGVEFVDPYLGRDDVVWEVNAGLGDDEWQAEVVASDYDTDLGECDLYSTEFIGMHRIIR